MKQDSISTKEWKERGLPFERWLRYTQLPEIKIKEITPIIRAHYPILPKKGTKNG